MSLYNIIIIRVIKEALFKIWLQVCDPPSSLYAWVIMVKIHLPKGVGFVVPEREPKWFCWLKRPHSAHVGPCPPQHKTNRFRWSLMHLSKIPHVKTHWRFTPVVWMIYTYYTKMTSAWADQCVSLQTRIFTRGHSFLEIVLLMTEHSWYHISLRV